MKIIDRLIRNSKPFKELEVNVDFRVREAVIDDYSNLLDEYAIRVEKLIDLTERVHNTILSAKHNQDSH